MFFNCFCCCTCILIVFVTLIFVFFLCCLFVCTYGYFTVSPPKCCGCCIVCFMIGSIGTIFAACCSRVFCILFLFGLMHFLIFVVPPQQNRNTSIAVIMIIVVNVKWFVAALLNVALLWMFVNDHDLSMSFDCCRFLFDSMLVSLPLSAYVFVVLVASECRRMVYITISFSVFDCQAGNQLFPAWEFFLLQYKSYGKLSTKLPNNQTYFCK